MRSDGYNIRMSLAEAKGCLQKKKSIFEDMSKNVRMNEGARLVRHHIKGEGQGFGGKYDDIGHVFKYLCTFF